jgi:putative ABC transport system permease protein
MLLRPFILRAWKREPLRAFATLFGVALGLAVIVAIELSKRSSIRSFKDSLNEMAGKAALEIRGPNGVPESALPQLYDLRDHGTLCPIVESEAFSPPWQQSLRVLGVDMLRDREVRDYQLVEFADERRQPSATEFLQLLSDASSVVISEKLAQRHALKVGSQFPVVFGDKPVSLTVRGILMPQGVARAMEGNILIMDLGAVQWHGGKMGRIDRLEIKVPEDAALEDAIARIQPKLPPGLNVGRPGRRGAEVEKMLGAYHFNLTLLGGIAFLAGICVLYNSINLSVLGRRSEIGMLRTLGTSRRQILGLFLGESFTFGLLGSVLGILLGRALAVAALEMQATTTATLYGQVGGAEAPSLSLGFLASIALLGLGMALVAAWRPAQEAANLSPVAAISAAPPAQSGKRATARLWALLLLAAAVVGCFVPPIQRVPWGGVFACFAAVVASGLLLPDLLAAVLALAAPWAKRRRGPAWQLACGGLKTGKHRLGVPLAALSGTLALSAAIAVMVGSFRSTLNHWIDQGVAADLYFRPASKLSGASESYLSQEVLTELRQCPEVASVEELRLMDIPYADSRVLLSVPDFQSSRQDQGLSLRGFRTAREALDAAVGSHGVLVSEAFARRYGLWEGDSLELATTTGVKQFPIVAIFYDYSNDRGTVMLDRREFEKHYGTYQPTNAAAYLKSGVAHEAVAEAFRKKFAASRAIDVFTNAGLRREIVRIFDATFAITWTLEIIALLVAMASVATTIFTLVLERKDELNTLRQLGTSAGQMRRAFAVEGLLLGGVSQVGGLVLGLLLSLVLIYVINVQSFGWTIQFNPPWGLLVAGAILAPLATAAAAMLASRGVAKWLQRGAA